MNSTQQKPAEPGWIMRHRWWLAALLVIVATGPWWLRLLLFDESRPARDRNYEYIDGKCVAWGPYPRGAGYGPTLLGFPAESQFFGDEWFFRLYRPYCIKWAEENGYAYPPPQAW